MLIEVFHSFTRTDTVTDMIAVTISVATQINSSFTVRHDYLLEGGVIFEAVLQDWRKSHTTTNKNMIMVAERKMNIENLIVK